MQMRMHSSRVEWRLAELVAFDTRNPGDATLTFSMRHPL
jgi:hypothetical protein